jgi:hypothetical protein
MPVNTKLRPIRHPSLRNRLQEMLPPCPQAHTGTRHPHKKISKPSSTPRNIHIRTKLLHRFLFFHFRAHETETLDASLMSTQEAPGAANAVHLSLACFANLPAKTIRPRHFMHVPVAGVPLIMYLPLSTDNARGSTFARRSRPRLLQTRVLTKSAYTTEPDLYPTGGKLALPPRALQPFPR